MHRVAWLGFDFRPFGYRINKDRLRPHGSIHKGKLL
jgi:hypothetical protein